MRPLLFVSGVLSYLCARPSESRTVSPIVYFTTTAVPNAAYGPGPGRSRSVRNDDDRGHGLRPATVYSTHGYGHRSMPPSTRKVRGGGGGRDEQPVSHALYESPDTYAYMTNPRKSTSRSRVPGTERRPPGDDVELIDGGERPWKTAGHRDDGRRDEEEDRDDRDDRENRKKKKKKKKRKTPTDADVESSEDVVRKGENAPRKSHAKNGGLRSAGAANDDRDDAEEPVKHKILKKNEYSKQKEFYVEEHVDHGKKKQPSSIRYGDGRHKGHKNRQQSGVRPRHDSSKKRKRRVKDEKEDRESRVEQQQQHQRTPGYGQVLAVR